MNNLKTSETNQEFNHETNDLNRKINLAADLGYPCLEDLEDELGTDWEKLLVYDFNQSPNFQTKKFTNIQIIIDQLKRVADVYYKDECGVGVSSFHSIEEANKPLLKFNTLGDVEMECLTHFKALNQQLEAIIDSYLSNV